MVVKICSGAPVRIHPVIRMDIGGGVLVWGLFPVHYLRWDRRRRRRRSGCHLMS